MSYPGRSFSDEFSWFGRSNSQERRLKEESTMTTNATLLTVARAEALFTSQLATGSRPTFDVAETAIRIAVRTHGGVRGCAADVAAEYGDYPEVAAPRMRWARSVVEQLYEVRRARAQRPTNTWALAA
jgi:hypothetical protein